MNKSAPSIPSQLVSSQRGFWWFVLVSVLVHVLLIAYYGYHSGHRRPTIDLGDQVIKTKLVRLGKKRDPKFLPRKRSAPKPKAKEKLLASKDDPKPAPTKKEAPKVDKMKEALKKIQEKAQREEQRQRALQRIAERVGDDEQEGDPEGSAFGTETQAARLTLTQAYFAKLHDRIMTFYHLPSTLSEADRRRLQAIVVISVGSDGRLVDQDFEKRSGNDAFDSALEAAVSRASPLPAPPAFLRDTLRDGVGLRFRP